MKAWKKRAAVIAAGLAVVGVASALILNALNSNIALFVTPSQVVAGEYPENRAFRIGGMVQAGSIERDNMTTRFIVTDLAQNVSVSYTGILPDLFKEGKGTVVQGKLDSNGHFVATEVLAKHDENYMPPEAQHAIDQVYKHQKQTENQTQNQNQNQNVSSNVSSNSTTTKAAQP